MLPPAGHNISVNATNTSSAGAPAILSRLNRLSASFGPWLAKTRARLATPLATARGLGIRLDVALPPPFARTYLLAPRRSARPSDVRAPLVMFPRAPLRPEPAGTAGIGGYVCVGVSLLWFDRSFSSLLFVGSCSAFEGSVAGGDAGSLTQLGTSPFFDPPNVPEVPIRIVPVCRLVLLLQSPLP